MEGCSGSQQRHVEVARARGVPRGAGRTWRTRRSTCCRALPSAPTSSHADIAPRSVRDLRGAADDNPERRAGASPGPAPTLIRDPRVNRLGGPVDAVRVAVAGFPMTALLAPAATERWAVFPVALGRLGTNVTLKPSPRPCSAPPGAAWASRRHELTLGGLRSRQRTTVLSATNESLLLHQILDLDRSFAGPASSNILEATAGPALRQRAAACLPAAPMSPHFRNLSRPQVRRHGDPGHRVQGQGPRHGARRKLSRTQATHRRRTTEVLMASFRRPRPRARSPPLVRPLTRSWPPGIEMVE